MTRRVVAHVRELLADTLTPLAVADRLARLSPVRFLFESVTGGEQVSRYSFAGAGPREILALWPERLERWRDGRVEVLDGAPLDALRSATSGYRLDQAAPVPFGGGWVGFFGYDVVRLVERLPHRRGDEDGRPIALLARFDEVVAFDHARQRVVLVANEVEGDPAELSPEERLDRLSEVLTTPGSTAAVELPREVAPRRPPESAGFPAAAFEAAVEVAKEHIRAGDIFQVVLARRYSVPTSSSPLAIYRALRLVNPSPYMVLLELPEIALIGASPEMLVRVQHGRVETRPIAGTRPRGADAASDQALADELMADPKERAEHVMLVDLGRNDLGRIATGGSVKVDSLMQIERYSHVMHIVSSVSAALAPDRSALDALLACFPAGTVSGAPKVRAMEIIDALEPEGRGAYAGAIGYLSYGGDLDTCITIRTLVVAGGEASVMAGGGIVADSSPVKEREESENKAAAVLAAVALAAELDRAAGGSKESA